MSRLYFHTESATAEILGWEAAWIRAIPRNIALGFVPLDKERLNSRLLPSSPMRSVRYARDVQESIRLEINVGWSGDHFCDKDGNGLDTYCLVLNTALAVGSDPVALITRISAQCEIHCFIEEQDRKWAADLLGQAYDSGVLRTGAGWSKVIQFLQLTNDNPGPVVCSYSVTDGFPNESLGFDGGWQPPTEDWADEANLEAWHNLPEASQWAYAMEGARKYPGGLQIAPATFRETFGHNLSFIDLFVTSPVAAKA